MIKLFRCLLLSLATPDNFDQLSKAIYMVTCVFLPFRLRSWWAGSMSCLSLYPSGLHVQLVRLYVVQRRPTWGWIRAGIHPAPPGSSSVPWGHICPEDVYFSCFLWSVYWFPSSALWFLISWALQEPNKCWSKEERNWWKNEWTYFAFSGGEWMRRTLFSFFASPTIVPLLPGSIFF